MQLGEGYTLDSWEIKSEAGGRTHQKAISQPVIDNKHSGGNDIDRFGVDEELVSKRPGE